MPALSTLVSRFAANLHDAFATVFRPMCNNDALHRWLLWTSARATSFRAAFPFVDVFNCLNGISKPLIVAPFASSKAFLFLEVVHEMMFGDILGELCRGTWHANSEFLSKNDFSGH